MCISCLWVQFATCKCSMSQNKNCTETVSVRIKKTRDSAATMGARCVVFFSWARLSLCQFFRAQTQQLPPKVLLQNFFEVK